MRISDWSSDGGSSDLAGRKDDRLGAAGRDRRGRGSRLLRPPVGRVLDVVGIGLRPLPQRRLSATGRTASSSPSRGCPARRPLPRSEEHTSELQSLMRISYAVFCLKKKKKETQCHNAKNR